MRSPEEISASARDVRAFSNGTEGFAWMGNWCHECKHDDDETEKWCPILTLAMIGEKTPAEWVEKNPYGLGDRYECTEFEPRDEDGDDPEPEPEPVPEDPNQLTIFDMFVDEFVASVEEPAHA